MFMFVFILFLYSPLLSLVSSLICLFFTKKPFIYCALIALVIALVAYCFEPPSMYDLYRIYEKASWLKDVNIIRFFELYSDNLEIFFNLTVYLLLQKFNVHIISGFFSLIGYLIMFYIICDYSKGKKLTSFQIGIVVVIFLMFYQHMYLISGIRNFIAVIFFSLLLYIEKIKKYENNITHLLYIIPLLFHNSMIVFIIIRILIEFNNKIVEKLITVIAVISAVAPMLLLKLLQSFQTNSFLTNIYTKLNGYFSGNYSFYSLLIIAAMLLQLLVYIKMYKYSKKHNQKNNKYYVYFKYILIICVGLIPYSVLFDRLLVMLSCISVIVLIDYVKSLDKINLYNRFVCYIFIIAIGALTFRNQIHNYYNDLSPAIMNVLNNNFFDLIKNILR